MRPEQWHYNIEDKGFSYYKLFGEQICNEALTRFNNTNIKVYEFYGNPSKTEYISSVLKGNKNLVINFAHPDNVVAIMFNSIR